MFKLDIGDPKSKRTAHLETANDAFLGRKIGDKIEGKEIPEVPDFKDYEFTITGASTKAGLPSLPDVEAAGLKRVLLTKGKALNAKKPKGLRKKITVHGNIISEDIMQINLKVSKEGAKPFSEIFKKPEAEKPAEEAKPVEEEKPAEEKPAEEVKEEAKPAEEKREEKTEEKAE